MTRIACVGDNCVDLYDNTGERYFGGNPVNVAVYIRRLGGEAAYIGAVGDDENGRLMLDAIAAKGVDVSRVQVLHGSTALSHVERIGGERVFGDYEEGVMADFALTEGDLNYLSGFELAVSGLWGRAERDMQRLQAQGLITAFDCAERPEDEAAQTALPYTDIAFFSDDCSDDAALHRRMLGIAALGPGIVVATRGVRGSLAYADGIFTAQGIVDCPVVDTMGAGDSFIAGFLDARLKGSPLPGCMAAGAQCSAVTLGYAGAW